MKIIAIGGGSVGTGETEAIDRELIALSGLAYPSLLFIPTASSDNQEYSDVIAKTYSSYGCNVKTLWLLGADANEKATAAKIAEADLVYVGGGNTKMMLEVWRRLKVDRALKSHLDAGKPAGGLSAGAICWFRMGNSDWPVYEGIPGVNTAPLEGLGLVDLAACPHTLRETHRLGEFREMMKSVGGVGIGLDDCCAIEIVDDRFRILASQEGCVAHQFQVRGTEVLERVLDPHQDFRALADLNA